MKLELVKCNENYYDFIRELRIHPDNIQGFIVQGTITSDEQKEYMKKNEKDYYVCLLDKEPAGFVGVIENDIRVATKPEYKKNGIAKFMINEVMKIYPNSKAKIKSNNVASISLFKSCGFETEFVIMKK